MKSDLDRLMQDRGFDAIVVMGEARENHTLRYMTNGARISQGMVIKKRGEEPVLICDSMEREEAARSGLSVLTHGELKLIDLINETHSPFEGYLRMLGLVFERYSVKGIASFYGLGDRGYAYIMLSRLAALSPDLKVTGETERTIFDDAYLTKDADEMAEVKSVAERTNRVVEDTMSFITGHAVQDRRMVKKSGEPLTVREVKRFLRGRLLEYELEDNGETIFAIGRDAGVPHSRGEDDDHLELGKTIIFDLFPRPLGGGYFHDMTRTFCLGFAPPEVIEAYDQVMHAFNNVMEELAVGQKYSRYQEMTCDFFEKHGHPTIRSNASTVEGYVHGLGHGLGLQIHARPRMYSDSTDLVQIGHVITIEPGLYYPDKGFGVRIEDTVYIDEKGEAHSLTPYPKTLIVPVG